MSKIFTPFTKPGSDETWLKEKNPWIELDDALLKGNPYDTFEQTALSNARVVVNPVEGKEEYSSDELRETVYTKTSHIKDHDPIGGGIYTHDECGPAYEYIVKEERAKEEAQPKEWILSAAIHYDDGKVYEHQPNNVQTGYVVTGRRHHNCIRTASLLLGDNYNRNFANRDNQGFITNLDRFVNRKEAFKIALKAKQIIHNFYDSNNQDQILVSEDLY